jgi:hypothetical protein
MKITEIWPLFLNIVVGLLVTVASPIQFIHAQEFTPPLGKWKIVADGAKGFLDIKLSRILNSGSIPALPTGREIVGTIKLGTEKVQNILGFYNDNLRRIIFVRITNSSDITQDQIFTGYLFSGTLSNSTGLDESCSHIGGFENIHTITGFFEAISGHQALSRNNVRGWYAENSYCQQP